jgi:hypothetical protein
LNDEGNFDPAHIVTRAEAAAYLYDAQSFIEANKENAAPEQEATE